MSAPQSAIDALGVLGVELESGDLDALGRYLDALYRANATMNLTAVPEGRKRGIDMSSTASRCCRGSHRRVRRP